MMRWMHAQHPPCPWDESTCESAIRDNECDNDDSIKRLHWLRLECDPPCPWYFSQCLRKAASCASIKTIEWLYDHRSPSTDPSLESLHNVYLFQAALHSKKIETLECLFAHGYPLSPSLYVIAGEDKHFWALQYLHDRDPPCPWDQSICTALATYNHFRALKYLRTKCNPPCPWQEHDVCVAACQNQRFDLFRFVVVEQSARCDITKCLQECIRRSSHAMIEWILKHTTIHWKEPLLVTSNNALT